MSYVLPSMQSMAATQSLANIRQGQMERNQSMQDTLNTIGNIAQTNPELLGSQDVMSRLHAYDKAMALQGQQAQTNYLVQQMLKEQADAHFKAAMKEEKARAARMYGE